MPSAQSPFMPSTYIIVWAAVEPWMVSAELVQMRREGLVEYTRCYFCVDDLAGLDRVAAG